MREYISGNCDTDENGYLSLAEREAVTEVSLSGLHVTDTTGIGCFSNLQKLEMQGNSADPDDRVAVLDLRGLDRLVELDVRGCGLTSLSLGYTPRVKKLYCQNNNLTSLNLAPYESLESVMAQDNPDLASLEVGPNIRTLYCYGTAVTGLDLLANPYLTYLAGLEGRITTYYVSGGTATCVVYSGRLNDVYCTMEVNDPRPDLIIDGIPVDEAHFPDPGFRHDVSVVIDTNHNGWLTPDERAATRLALRGGDIRSARGLAYFPALTELLIPLSSLEEIDVSGNPDLQRLNLYQNALTALDVSMLGALTNLDVGENPRLASLALGSAPLTRLNVAGCTDLAVLDLSGQPALLKARLTDSGTALPESGFSYTWTSDDGTLTATLLAEAELDVLRPAWIWNSPEDVIFRLPDGREVQAAVTAAPEAHGNTMVCSAVATVDGVPFTQNRILHQVRFQGASVPAQWVASGETAAEPAPPVRIGSVFAGWYTAADGGEPVDFTAPLTAWRVFHAHWLTPGTENALRLPPQLTVIEAGAFTGTAADAVIIPSGVTQIAPDAFDDSNVRWVFGIPGSAAQTHADAHPSLTFVPVNKTWMTQH